MKDDQKLAPINVINAMRGFDGGGLKYKITPYRIQTSDGTVHIIDQIRRVTTQTVGSYMHYHYVVQTKEQRYFHIVFDSALLSWKLVQEVDEALFFDK